MLFWWICHHELRVHYIVIISLVFQLPVTFSVLLIFSMIFSPTRPPRYPHVTLSLLEEDCFSADSVSLQYLSCLLSADTERYAFEQHLKLLLRSLATKVSC